MELIVVDAAQCRPLREDVMFPGAPAEAARYASDDFDDAMHLALKDEEETLAVVSILPEPGGEGLLWRMAGPAVRPDRQGQGLGRQLLEAVQMVVGQRGGGFWTAVPVDAAPFFEGCGLTAAGEPTEEPGRGRVQLMTWQRGA